jgi:hypothetical protein
MAQEAMSMHQVNGPDDKLALIYPDEVDLGTLVFERSTNRVYRFVPPDLGGCVLAQENWKLLGPVSVKDYAQRDDLDPRNLDLATVVKIKVDETRWSWLGDGWQQIG